MFSSCECFRMTLRGHVTLSESKTPEELFPNTRAVGLKIKFDVAKK